MAHIVSLEAQNFKKLKAVRIEPNENGATILAGQNGAGKSSVLDAILAALAGKSAIEDVPVRVGEDEATLKVVISTEPAIVVERTIKPNGQTTLKLYQETEVGGEKIKSNLPKPQSVLDRLVGNVAFDPLEFSRKKPAEQVTILAKICGVDPSEVDKQIADLMEQRKLVGNEVKSVEARLEKMPRHEDVPADVVDVKLMLDELNKAKKKKEDVRLQWKVRYEQTERAKEILQEMDALKEELERIQQKLAEPEPSAETIDIESIEKRIELSSDVNRKVQENKSRAQVAAELETIQAKHSTCNALVEEARQRRVALMDSAKWPVPGLGFSEHGVTFNGLPFTQCSSAEQLKIGAGIAMSTNPGLKLMFIRDGSLLDANSLKTLQEMAISGDCQVFIERVGTADDGAIVIEDGEVLA